MKLGFEVFVENLRFEVAVTSRDIETHKRMTEQASRLREAIRRAIVTAMRTDSA